MGKKQGEKHGLEGKWREREEDMGRGRIDTDNEFNFVLYIDRN